MAGAFHTGGYQSTGATITDKACSRALRLVIGYVTAALGLLSIHWLSKKMRGRQNIGALRSVRSWRMVLHTGTS